MIILQQNIKNAQQNNSENHKEIPKERHIFLKER